MICFRFGLAPLMYLLYISIAFFFVFFFFFLVALIDDRYEKTMLLFFVINTGPATLSALFLRPDPRQRNLTKKRGAKSSGPSPHYSDVKPNERVGWRTSHSERMPTICMKEYKRRREHIAMKYIDII